MALDPAESAIAYGVGEANAALAIPVWKRALDLSIGLTALVVLGPVMVAAAVLVRLSGPGPLLFRQTRIGLGGRPFTMLKFRTMAVTPANEERDDNEPIRQELNGDARPNPDSGLFRPAIDPRATGVGRIMRQYSIDELPQLLNVLRGDMSLVGPRPALPAEVALFSPRQRQRHASPPGITGLWQVSGRNRLSTAEMLELDLQYLNRRSLRVDLAILLRTPKAALIDRLTR